MAKVFTDTPTKEREKPFGRPKEWTEERLKDAANHLNEYLDRAKKDKSIFWWKDWCFDYGILPSQCVKLAEKSLDFREAYQRACEWQEQIVVKYALAKKFADNFSQFYLKTQHKDKWGEKVDDGIGQLTIDQFNALAAMMEARQSKVVSALNNAESNKSEETKS